MTDAPTLLRQLFDSAVDAVSPRHCLGDSLSHLYDRDALLIGAGKAAASMAAELETHWRANLHGLVVVPYAHAAECHSIEVIEAAHPIPDAAGIRASERILSLVAGLTAQDLVICAISGGGSSLLSMPVKGISLADKQAVNAQLLRSGAAISEINCVRKQLSAIKGGKLALAAAPATLVTVLISDVPGNDVSVIASGPTVANTTTAADALGILQHYGMDIPDAVNNHLTANLKTELPAFDSSVHVLATSDTALDAAAALAGSFGIATLNLGDLEGDSTDLAAEHARLAMQIANGAGPVAAPAIILSGGETTVRVRGNGRGGRNGEYAMALAIQLDGHPEISAIVCDTDGIDGSGDNAGCLVTPDTLARAAKQSIDVDEYQSRNDSYHLFAALNDLIVTGPTLTNVNDFRAIFIDRAN